MNQSASIEVYLNL